MEGETNDNQVNRNHPGLLFASAIQVIFHFYKNHSNWSIICNKPATALETWNGFLFHTFCFQWLQWSQSCVWVLKSKQKHARANLFLSRL